MPTWCAWREQRPLERGAGGDGGGWPVGGKVLMGRVHGPWRSGAARFQARAQAEEGGQRRGGGSPVRLRRGSPPARKVGVQWLWKQPCCSRSLRDLHVGRGGGEELCPWGVALHRNKGGQWWTYWWTKGSGAWMKSKGVGTLL
jgi:hypothetical protein